jgi:hypothetical protein
VPNTGFMDALEYRSESGTLENYFNDHEDYNAQGGFTVLLRSRLLEAAFLLRFAGFHAP